MRQLGVVAIFCVFAGAAMVANAEETPSPRGWSDTHTEAGRVLTKGTSKIVVSNWVDLQGRSVSAYLQTLEKSVPPNAQFVSSKGVKPDRLDGTFSVTRKVQLGRKQGQSVLYACPGQSGFARILSLTFESSKFGDAMSGGMFLENACKTEVKGGSKVAESAPVTRPNSRPTSQSPSLVHSELI